MRVRIIEKIHNNRTNNPNLTTPLCRQKNDYWIRELGTATPYGYGCNDKVDGIGILSSPTCRSVNHLHELASLSLFNRADYVNMETSPSSVLFITLTIKHNTG
jgi:hypothetical protein